MSIDDQLGQRYDALNEQITEAMKNLRSLRPLRSACTQTQDGELALTRKTGEWALWLANMPLLEVPIDARMRASHHIPYLYDVIMKQKVGAFAEVDECIAKLEEWNYLFKKERA